MNMLSGAIVILAGAIIFSSGVLAGAVRDEIGYIVGVAVMLVGAVPFFAPWWASAKGLWNTVVEGNTNSPQGIPGEAGPNIKDDTKQQTSNVE